MRVRPAAFLDLDVLLDSVEDRPEGVQGTEGAIKAIRALNDRGYYVFVVHHHRTRVAHGACQLSTVLQERLAAEGAHVDRLYGGRAEPPDIGPGLQIAAARRTPGSNPFFEAMSEWPIVRERSFSR